MSSSTKRFLFNKSINLVICITSDHAAPSVVSGNLKRGRFHDQHAGEPVPIMVLGRYALRDEVAVFSERAGAGDARRLPEGQADRAITGSEGPVAHLARLKSSFDFAVDWLERRALTEPATDKQDCSRFLLHQGGEGRARHLGGYVRVLHFFEGGVAVGLQPDRDGVGVVSRVLDPLDSIIFDENALASELGAQALQAVHVIPPDLDADHVEGQV